MGKIENFHRPVKTYPMTDTEMLDWFLEYIKRADYVDPTPTHNGHYVMDFGDKKITNASGRQAICDHKTYSDEVNS